MNANLTHLSKTLLLAEKNRHPISQLTSRYPDLSLPEAYEIQRISVEAKIEQGNPRCGYKMGLTSRAKQVDVKVFEPIHGSLLKGMRIKNGASLRMNQYIHPRVEPEVAVVIRQRLDDRDLTLKKVLSAVGSIFPAAEILDSRYEGFQFSLSDVVADNTSASGFILGKKELPCEPSELNFLGVIVRKNGEIVQTGCPAAVLGDPMLSVLELVRLLGREGRAIEKDSVILTGGLTSSISFQEGDNVEIEWPDEFIRFSVGA